MKHGNQSFFVVPPLERSVGADQGIESRLISQPHFFPRTLDLSFNTIRKLPETPLDYPKLVHLFLVQNLISAIPEATFTQLPNLETLELGANRLRKLENLDKLTKLESLWIGKNKIGKLENLEALKKLKILSAQSNRIRKIEGLDGLESLEELYLSHNGINTIENLDNNVGVSLVSSMSSSQQRSKLTENKPQNPQTTHSPF